MKKVYFIIIITVFYATHTHGQQPALLKNNLRVLAQKYNDAYYDKLELDEKRYLDREKVKLKEKVIDARRLSATAVVVSSTASSEFLPIVMSAVAALSDPEDALVVNNFGAMIRTLYGEDLVKISGWCDDAVIALLYAKTLQPDSPLILTNLGNSYIDKKMFAEAELCYKEAIKYDRDFGTAHEGMAKVYINKKDGKRAIDELIKAGKFGFSPSMRKGYNEAKKCGGFVDASFWEDSQDNDKSQSDNEDNKRQNDKLVLPDFPKWENKGAFAASAPKIINFAQAIIEKATLGGLEFAAKYHADELTGSFENVNYDSDPDYDGDMHEIDSNFDDDNSLDMEDMESVKILPSYGQKLFMLELVNDYYTHKIEQEYNKNLAKRKQIDETYKNGLIDIQKSTQYQQLEEKLLMLDIYGSKLLAKDMNIRSAQLAEAHFTQWRDMTLETYRELKTLLNEYWKVAYQVTGDIYNQDALNYFNDIREITVYASLVPIAMDFTLLPVTYALADYYLPFVEANEDLSQYIPKPVSDIEMLEKEIKKCPVEGKKSSFGIGPVGFAITCDTWEIEYLEGIGGSYKRNFKNGSSEVTVLVGVKKSAGNVEFGAKQGITFKFNNEGDFTGWSTKSEAGVKVGVGPISMNQNLEYSSDIGMITAPRGTISIAVSGVEMGVGGN